MMTKAFEKIKAGLDQALEMTQSGKILIEKDDIIQIVPDHKWGGCLAVVDEPKSFGCQAYVTIPGPDGNAGEAYIRLNWNEFEPVGAKAIFVPQPVVEHDDNSEQS